MSRRKKQQRGRTAQQRGRKVLAAKSPGDLLAIIPYQLGFHPVRSLVVISVSAERSRLAFSLRVDLPAPEHTAPVADQVSAALRRNGARSVLIVAYSTDAQTAQPLVEEVLRRFDEQGVAVMEALRADGERWYSYRCDGLCCPSEGTAYDNSCHPLTAEAVVEGEVALPDRSALERSVAPVVGIAAVSMAQAAARAEEALVGRIDAGQDATAVRAALVAEMRTFVTTYLHDPRRLSDDESAQLAVWAQFIPVRDAAWTMMTRQDAGLHLDLWRQILRRVPPPYEPAVACLTAFAAWLNGNGALAGCALERALAADPDYSWARLIDDTLRAALDPSSWDEVAQRLAG